LAVGAQAIAQLRLEAPAFVCLGDRLTLRDWSELHTLAGALVLDPDAVRKGFRDKARLEWLEGVAGSIEDPERLIAAYVGRDGAVRRPRLLLKSRFSNEDRDVAIDRLVVEGALVAAGDIIVDAARWQAAVRRAADMIDAAHQAHPEHLGVPLVDLRTTLQPELPIDELFEPIISRLCEHAFERAGSVVRRASYRAELPGPLQVSGAKVRQTLTDRPLDPPSRKELAPDVSSQRALRFLVETGEAIEISAELVMAAPAVAQAVELIRTFIRDHGPATVSDLRQALGSSRRVIVPLLEHLDRTFVTLRQGDKRRLR
jgi:selenocysteine-specific elongation factor